MSYSGQVIFLVYSVNFKSLLLQCLSIPHPPKNKKKQTETKKQTKNKKPKTKLIQMASRARYPPTNECLFTSLWQSHYYQFDVLKNAVVG